MLHQKLPRIDSTRLDGWGRWLAPALALAAGLTVALLLALIGQSRNQLLLASCFCYTIVLEWVGTAIGNWHWSAVVPGVGLHSANPPAGVGILYILLDLITMAITSRISASAVDNDRLAPAADKLAA